MRLKNFLWFYLLTAFIQIILNLSLSHVFAKENNTVSTEAATVVEKISIQVHPSPFDKTDWVELANRLIFLKKGDLFATDQLQQSINALKLSKKFQKISVDSQEENGKITLFFDLIPSRFIKDIKIAGNYPLFEREILNVMTIYTGDIFFEEELPEQTVLIENLFKQDGYIHPKVDVTAQEDPKDGFFIVYIKIDKGHYYVLDRIKMDGNRVFSNLKIKSKMKVWRVSLRPGSSGRFIEEFFKKDIIQLTQYYRKKGYAEAEVAYSLEKDDSSGSVTVLLKIKEGPRYKVEFSGNKAFWDRSLKKNLVLFTEGNKNNRGIRKSIRNIKERYQEAGYLEARVKVEREEKSIEDETVRILRFVVAEGPCTTVELIRIEGNHAFDDQKIKKQMLTRMPGFMEKGIFVPEILEDDINAIKSLYLKEGYSNIQIKPDLNWSDDKAKLSVALNISEGIQTIVSSMEVTGIQAISMKEAYAVISLKKGQPFRKYMLQSDENSLSALISEKGYPHVKVKGDVRFSSDQSNAQVIYNVDEGPDVKMGAIYYSGNFRTQKHILQKEIELREGDLFLLKKMFEGQRNIRNMEIFNSVKFKTIGLKEKRDKVDLFVEIEEKKPYFIDLGGGYDTERGLFVHAKAGDLNLFGTNKYGWVGGEASEIGYRVESGITEPRLFGSRISSNLNVFGERKEEFNQDFGTKTLGASLGFTRKQFKNLNLGLGFSFERREQYRLDSDSSNFDVDSKNDEFDPRSILVVTPTIFYNTRDSFIRPKKGIYSSFAVDISKGIENSLDDFLKYRLDLRFYWTPIHWLTFAWLGRAGYIDPYGAVDSVPDDQLFFLGGIADVRGFDENLLLFDADGDPVGGRSAVSASIEARIDLGRNYELTTFYDVGRVGDTISEKVSDGFRPSIGVGLRYITPIGPIGFLYGMNLDREEGESFGILHFSLGYTF
ncbi:MAG: outer membrane protein assembly factor BamA [Desulfobacterales bacterium]|nr:outer membrane protein assembly factor BamA [Desulfobacterales bacterium]